MAQIKIALAGNPNCGKTTLFNALTGANQYVGNWPGVTVEKKDGRLKDNRDVTVQDLPGIYSLSPYTLEEVVARNYLVNEKPDAILNIVDGTNIERNLYLTTQLIELGIPVVIAVNMADLVRKNGDRIDLEQLGAAMGCKAVAMSALKGDGTAAAANAAASGKKISLKRMTLNNARQKINDCLGNPVEIGIAVIWQVKDTAKAVFNVDNYKEYLSLQCDSALRNVVRIYPYDVAPGIDTTGDGKPDDGSLRGSSEVVAERIRAEIQEKVEDAGIEVIDARITYLAYAPEIAAVMLQRQQASAIIDARKMIVDGAVGMVEMALDRLNENHVVELDDERKAAMVSNLLVVLCGNHDAQPVVNSGSLY